MTLCKHDLRQAGNQKMVPEHVEKDRLVHRACQGEPILPPSSLFDKIAGLARAHHKMIAQAMRSEWAFFPPSYT